LRKSGTFTSQKRHFYNSKDALLPLKNAIFGRKIEFKCKPRLILFSFYLTKLTFKNNSFSILKKSFVLIFYRFLVCIFFIFQYFEKNVSQAKNATILMPIWVKKIKFNGAKINN